MEERLKYICCLVDNWLKFAETKNAGLVVAATALFVNVCNHFPDGSASVWVRRWCVGGCALLAVAGAISLISFIPNITFRWFESRRQRSATDNLFFFGHIAAYSAFELLDALYQAESLPNPKKKLEADLAGQAVINSQIAVRKYIQFRTACSIAVVGVAALVICGILHVTK